MDMEQEVQRFRMEMLRKMPFYGDIMIRLPFEANPGIDTARTNGFVIEYSPRFFESLTTPQRNYVLMHEVLHVMLLHCSRIQNRNPALWNTAADLVVNTNLDAMARRSPVRLERPPDGIFGTIRDLETVEDVYEMLRRMNTGREKVGGKIKIPMRRSYYHENVVTVSAPGDLSVEDAGKSQGEGKTKASGFFGPQDANGGEGTIPEPLNERLVQTIIQESLEKHRGDEDSYFIPKPFLKPRDNKRLNWKQLLRSFLNEEMSEESSYITPERKYIHMDMILPGYSRDETVLEEVWAFVDSSGSIGMEEMEVFLTQLARICREFKCIFHICYWDTQVTDVYRNVKDEKSVWESLPRHSGGTDINCVYRWLRKEKVRPSVMLILTDGYFGSLSNESFIPSLKNKTILILSTDPGENGDMRRIGKLARL